MTGSITSMMDDAVQHAGKRLLERGGVTFGHAAWRAFKEECKSAGATCVEEFLNNFNSWYFQESMEGLFK